MSLAPSSILLIGTSLLSILSEALHLASPGLDSIAGSQKASHLLLLPHIIQQIKILNLLQTAFCEMTQ